MEEIVVLKNSIFIDGKEVKEVAIRKPKVGDLRSVGFGKIDTIDEFMKLINIVSVPKLNNAVMDSMELDDFILIQNKILSFLPQQDS